MKLGSKVAVISDVHGERSMLQSALSRCRQSQVESIVLLGDLFDRVDQAGPCAACLRGWSLAGVIGNHEREALAYGAHIGSDNDIHRLLGSLGESLQVGDALFVHDGTGWSASPERGRSSLVGRDHRLTFAGHTHYRHARDDHGPLDLTLGRIELRPDRRYLVNPGAAIEGRFAIWDRERAQIIFERVGGTEGG